MHFVAEMVFKCHDTKYLLAKKIYKKTKRMTINSPG